MRGQARLQDGESGIFQVSNAAHTDRFLAGDWLVSSLEYFAYREQESADQWIGDHTETQTIYRFDRDLSWDNGNVPAEAEYLRKECISPGRSLVGITLKNPTFAKIEPPAHIISLSYGDYESCANAMIEEPEPAYRYNACIEISDVFGFAAALWKEGRADGGTPLSAIFAEPLVGVVQYASQREFRIVFPHLHQWRTPDRIVFRLPNAQRFVSERFRDAPDLAHTNPSTDDLHALTTGLYREMGVARQRDRANRAWPPTYDADGERIRTGFSSPSRDRFIDENRSEIEKYSKHVHAQHAAANANSTLFENENSIALWKLLWRWRLAKRVRLRRNNPYRARPAFNCLDSLYAAMIAYEAIDPTQPDKLSVWGIMGWDP